MKKPIFSSLLVFLIVSCFLFAYEPELTTEETYRINEDGEYINSFGDLVVFGDEIRAEQEGTPRMEFPIDEYRSLPSAGTGTISGRVSCGEKGKHYRMYLNPITSYSEEWYQTSFIEGNKLSPANQRLFEYLRFSTSTKKGVFNFYGVPPGEFYLTVLCDGKSVEKTILVGLVESKNNSTTFLDFILSSDSTPASRNDGETFASDDLVYDKNRTETRPRRVPRYPSDD